MPQGIPNYGIFVIKLAEIWKNLPFTLNLVSQYCAETSSMTIYGHKWLKLICQHVFWPVLWFIVISRTKNWSKICQKYRFCPPWISNYQSGAWILCWDIFYDYLYSYMDETDIQACILTCVRVHGDLQDHKLVKNKPIMPILAPWILNIQSGAAILFQDISNDYLWS